MDVAPDPDPNVVTPGHVPSPSRRQRGDRGRSDLTTLADKGVAAIATTDVGAHRERSRSTRLQRVALVLAPIAILLVLRDVLDPGASIPVPHFPASLQP
ncbi:MAG TPA: hypothetical protein VF279_00435, partial [Acidimicrobiales bacterium]